jgi:hypothetical protein
LGLRGAGALEAIGGQRQQMGQRGMDLAYQDFLEQRDLPMERVGFMSDIVRGLPMSQRLTQTDRGPADIYQPSGLAQIAGAYGTIKGLTEEARGGRVRRYAGGRVRRYANGGLARVRDMMDLSPAEMSYA